MNTFVNFSNHPSNKWSEEQLSAAQVYGEVVDVPFPVMETSYKEEDIVREGDECVAKIMQHQPSVVMCQGEFTLTFYVVHRLMQLGIPCVSACTKRVSKETMLPDGAVHKESFFVFEGFRKYVFGEN